MLTQIIPFTLLLSCGPGYARKPVFSGVADHPLHGQECPGLSLADKGGSWYGTFALSLAHFQYIGVAGFSGQFLPYLGADIVILFCLCPLRVGKFTDMICRGKSFLSARGAPVRLNFLNK